MCWSPHSCQRPAPASEQLLSCCQPQCCRQRDLQRDSVGHAPGGRGHDFCFPGGKLIALTFDDGPRPYVLFGSKGVHPAPGLVDILDQNGVKATFFVVGWRLTPKTWGEPRHEEDIGVTCIDAAEQLIRRGHELEDHTYSHLELRSAEKKNGEQWVMGDVDRGAQAIKAVTGMQPRYVRPPDWIITNDARRDLQQQGYRVLTISSENPMALRDVNSLDYLCAGKAVGCPKPSLADAVLQQVEQREKKGTSTRTFSPSMSYRQPRRSCRG